MLRFIQDASEAVDHATRDGLNQLIFLLKQPHIAIHDEEEQQTSVSDLSLVDLAVRGAERVLQVVLVHGHGHFTDDGYVRDGVDGEVKEPIGLRDRARIVLVPFGVLQRPTFYFFGFL